MKLYSDIKIRRRWRAKRVRNIRYVKRLIKEKSEEGVNGIYIVCLTAHLEDRFNYSLRISLEDFYFACRFLSYTFPEVNIEVHGINLNPKNKKAIYLKWGKGLIRI